MSRQTGGTIVGGVIGAVIGFYFGGPNGAALGYSIGSGVGGYVTAPDVNTQGPQLSDSKAPVSSYGAAIPRLYGSKSLFEIRVWSTGLVEHSKEQDVGGKGGGSQTQTTYSYTASWACLLCEGTIESIRRIWFDSKLVYDKGAGTNIEAYVVSSEIEGKFTVYAGTETQGIDPTIEADVGVGNASAYRGWAYVVFSDVDVTKFGHIPYVEFDVVSTIESEDYVFPDLFTDRPNYSEARDFYGYVGNGQVEFVDMTDVLFLTPATPSGVAVHELRDVHGRLLFKYNRTLTNVSTEATGYEAPVRSTKLAASSGSAVLQNTILQNKTISNRWVGWLQPNRHVAVSNSAGFYAITENGETVLGQASTASYHDGLTYILIGAKQHESDRIVVVDDINRVVGSYTHTHDIGDFTIGADGYIYAVSAYVAGFSSDIIKLNPGDLAWISTHTASTFDFTGWLSVAINLTDRVPRAVVSDGGYQGRYWVCDLETDFSLTLITYGTTIGTSFVARCVVYNDMILTHTGYWVAPFYNRDGGIALDVLVSDICDKAGLLTADYDVTDLSSSVVDGYGLASLTSARNAIQPLQQAYFFDAAEIGGKIVFVSRGGSVSANLATDDLGAYSEGEKAPQKITLIRGISTDLPRRVTVNYVQQDDYEIGSQYASRYTDVDTVAEIAIDLPLVLTDDQASQIAEVLLYGTWQSRERVSFSSTTYLDPTNIITISDESQVYTLRVLSVENAGLNGPYRYEAVFEDTSVYNSYAVGGESTSSVQTLSLSGPSQLEIIDSSLLVSTDSDDGLYLAATGYYDGWPGCVVFHSLDGTSWSQFASLTTVATIGSADNALGVASPAVYDTENTLTVTLLTGSLSSVTETAFLNGSNAALVGDEVILFQTATQVSTWVWTLSNLIRGVRGTEWAIDSHAIGDRFVLLDAATLTRARLSIDMIGVTQYLRAVTIGEDFESGIDYAITYTGGGYQCFSPAHLTGTDAGGGNYDLTWVRRVRKYGEWRDFVDVPLVEDTESYRVEVWSSGVLQSTADVTSESATVAASPGDVVRVAQLSSITGPGYYSEITL
jgi:hypothetical protein